MGRGLQSEDAVVVFVALADLYVINSPHTAHTQFSRMPRWRKAAMEEEAPAADLICLTEKICKTQEAWALWGVTALMVLLLICVVIKRPPLSHLRSLSLISPCLSSFFAGRPA